MTRDEKSPKAAWLGLRRALLQPEVDPAALEEALEAARARQPTPVLWLLGVAQSGKTSIVRALTGSSRAEIGNGFQPCTRSASLYDFPAAAPVLSFLDTRGLGEVAYDPAEDLAVCESRAHLVIVVLRAGDPAPAEVLEALQAVRKRHPDWPVVIAQTCLHRLYPDDAGHVLPYPFDQAGWEGRVPAGLRRALLAQRAQLEGLPGHGEVLWVPVDFTLREDGFAPEDYGADALWDAIEHALFTGLRARVIADAGVADVFGRAAHPRVVGYSLAAGAVGAVPVADLVLVPSLQAGMLYALAEIYGMHWTRRNTSEFLGALGAGFLLAYGGRALGRSLVKLVPVWGQTAGAAWGALASGAITFGLGKAACYYLARKREGRSVSAEQLREAYREGLREGRDMLRRREPGP
jgi:uncharacterized protein (DUF697 family)